MKHVILILTILVSSFTLYAQGKDIKTETFKVEGNCSMCKKRIEKAAFVNGVKRAEWDKESHMLSVIYRPSKTNTEAISKSIAKAGHNTEAVEASVKDYKSLPTCCQYKDNSCND